MPRKPAKRSIPAKTSRPDSRSEGLGDRAYEALRAAIQDGTLVPGQRLLESDISDWLQMSRTPVREALRRLCNRRLVEGAPGGGLAVSSYDLRAISELYDVREPFEGTAAALAAKNADETEIRMLQALVTSHKRLADDPVIHFRENKTFHEHIYRAAHNRFLTNVLDDLHDAVTLLGHATTFQSPGRIESALREHQKIVDAIAARAPDRADAAMREHVRNGYLARINMLTHAIGVDSELSYPPQASENHRGDGQELRSTS